MIIEDIHHQEQEWYEGEYPSSTLMQCGNISRIGTYTLSEYLASTAVECYLMLLLLLCDYKLITGLCYTLLK